MCTCSILWRVGLAVWLVSSTGHHAGSDGKSDGQLSGHLCGAGATSWRVCVGGYLAGGEIHVRPFVIQLSVTLI